MNLNLLIAKKDHGDGNFRLSLSDDGETLVIKDHEKIQYQPKKYSFKNFD